MPVLIQIVWIATCALALCVYAGWGAARLGLPASLRPQGALLVPLIGYAVAIWVAYLGVSSILSLRWSLALLLVIATALNLLAWGRGARPQPLAAAREHAAPLGLFVVTLLAGVLPLLHYGYATTIGEGWDTESYLPLAQHLNDYSLARIPDAPISPMRGLVSNPPAIGVTLGYSALQGMTMLLSGQTALATFAPLVALLRALGVLAIYAWLRATMGLGRAAALLAAALASAGALLLWVGYFNFAMQMAGWPLLALGLALGLAAVEELAEPTTDDRPPITSKLGPRSSVVGRRSSQIGVALLAAIALAALPVAYYPALTFWVPLAAGLGAARLVEQALTRRPALPWPQQRGSSSLSDAAVAGDQRSPDRGLLGASVFRLLLAALALGALALLLAAPTIQDYFGGFSFRYSLPAQHVGPDRFIAIRETLGLLAFRLPDDGPQPPPPLVWAASGIAGLLLAAGLALPTKDEGRATKATAFWHDHQSSVLGRLGSARLRWLAVVVATVAYLAWLRFGRPYQYGYMKGSAYAGFVAWGAVALGAQALWLRAGKRGQAVVAGLAAVPLLMALWAQALTIGDHWSGPANFRRDVAAFDQAAALVPADASVFVTSDAAFTGPTSGLFATMLYGREVWGHLATAYTGLNYWPEGRMPGYALLAAGERAWPLELGGRELWRSDAAVLYQLDERAQALLGRADIYTSGPVPSKKSPAGLEIWRRGGANRLAAPGAPLTFTLGRTPRFGSGQPEGDAAPQQVTLTVASLAPQRVSVAVGATANAFELQAGVSQISLPAATPTQIIITPEQPLALISMLSLPAGAPAQPGVRLDEQQIAWNVVAEQDGEIITLRLQTANPARRALRIGLTVIEDTFSDPVTIARVLAAAPLDDTWQLSYDPARGATEALVGGQPMPLLDVRTTPDPFETTYFGVLELYDGEEVVAHAPVFTFRMAFGKLAMVAPVPFTIEATPAGRMAGVLPGNRRVLFAEARVLDSRDAVLEQAMLMRRTPWPGAPADAPIPPGGPLTAQLFWQGGSSPAPPMMVSLQVLGADNHKWAQWDGALGGDWRPNQAWQAGERVRQDVPLRIDPATPPGSYQLVLVVYDPASGQPQTFGGQKSLQLGELIVR
ncbi:MAG TPA: hypothetical protein VFU22_10520 [Roseiflexaceae bacterium]|nr:hypothetical protein [Roseiflexaceae bacterium]